MQTVAPNMPVSTLAPRVQSFLDSRIGLGGYKQSGIGREHGRGALDNYLETKSVCIALN